MGAGDAGDLGGGPGAKPGVWGHGRQRVSSSRGQALGLGAPRKPLLVPVCSGEKISWDLEGTMRGHLG